MALFLCEGVKANVRWKAAAGDIIDNALGEARDLLIELHARTAECQMT